jgi:hypothetical protein
MPDDPSAEQAYPSNEDITLWQERAQGVGLVLRAFRPGAGFELSSRETVHQLGTWEEVKTWISIYLARAQT